MPVEPGFRWQDGIIKAENAFALRDDTLNMRKGAGEFESSVTEQILQVI